MSIKDTHTHTQHNHASIAQTMADFHPLRTASHVPTSKSFRQWDDEAKQRAKDCTTAEMPSLDHLSLKDFDKVYEPSDDTYLLLDGLLLALRQLDETERIGNQEEGEEQNVTMTTVEIGCGTGVATVFVAKDLATRNKPSIHFATDINPDALHTTRLTAVQNGVGDRVQTVLCDLASPFLTSASRLATNLSDAEVPDETNAGPMASSNASIVEETSASESIPTVPASPLPNLEDAVDVLIFNPPYVPTPDEEVGGNGIEASWAGGLNGRRVVDRALPQIARMLKPNGQGAAYIITVDDNLPEEMAAMFDDLGCTMVPWVRRRAYNEYLSVQRVTRKTQQELQNRKSQLMD